MRDRISPFPVQRLLTPEQIKALVKWSEYRRTSEYRRWLGRLHRNVRAYKVLLRKAKREDDVMGLLRLATKNQGGDRALNSRLLDKNSLPVFHKRLLLLTNTHRALPERVNSFLALKGIGVWSMSQLLCYSDPSKYAFVGDFMIQLLAIDNSQLTRALGFARERYPPNQLKHVSNETLRYLGLLEIFREIRETLGIKSFLGVQNVLWNAWEDEEEIKSNSNQRRGWRQLSASEALERGRQGELEVIRWERRQGRIPKDVAEQNLGCDIESVDKTGRPRYIEVKNYGGRPVALTSREYEEGRRSAENYFLYVLYDDPDYGRSIRIIQNPVKKCVLREKPTVQYAVTNWMRRGNSVRD